MTSKQCNSCKHHIHVKELTERCFYVTTKFMNKRNCDLYENGEINQAHKEYFKKVGKEYPFTEMR